MLEWIADKLGIASLAPFWPPAFGLLLSVVSALLTWYLSTAYWAGWILIAALTLSLWVYFENHRGVIAGFSAGLIAFQIGLGLTGVFASGDIVNDVICRNKDVPPPEGIDCAKLIDYPLPGSGRRHISNPAP